MQNPTLQLDPRLITLSFVEVPLWLMDIGRQEIIWSNPAGLDYWGLDNTSDLARLGLASSLSETTQEHLRQIVSRCYKQQTSVVESLSLFPQHAQGRTAEISFSPFPMDDVRQVLLCQLKASLDSTDTVAQRSMTLLNATSTMLSLFSADHKLLFCNNAARRAIPDDCQTLEQLLANEGDLYVIEEALESEESCCTELEVNTQQGVRWHNMTFQLTPDTITGETLWQLSAYDATEKRQARQQAYQLAYADSLTNLPNRAALNVYLDTLLAEEDQEHIRFSLFFLDLDRFKAINDSLGHAMGDKLLIEVAHRLKRSVGAHGMVCRLGGDEFVCIINNEIAIEKLRTLAEKVLNIMADTVELAGQNVRILPSIGICRYPNDGKTVLELMENADAAMYLAKSQHSGYCFFDEEISANLAESVKYRLGLENDLVEAINNHQFELYYQPKISADTQKVAGVEALLRWKHPTRGTVSPDDFIRIAEETGQIIELGNWVLDEAMQQQRLWHDAGYRIPMAINISARQFQDDDLVMTVSETLLRTRVDPAMIELEITETMLLGSADDVIETLQQLSSMGIRLALDDFGTGYSNLAYLQRYPLDTLKIDRIFLADPRHSLMMQTILEMGRVLGLTVVAEGVESASQVKWLTANGCDLLQGFYFSQPLPVDLATRYLEEHGARKSGSLHRAA